MSVPVPRDFPFPSRSGIASGKPVRAGQIAQVGHALNYLKGHGHTVIPAMALTSVAVPPGTTYTYDAIAILKPWTRHVVWSFRPRINTAGGFASGTFTGMTGATFAFSALRSEPEYRAITTAFRFVEALTGAPSAPDEGTPVTFSIENDATSTHSVYIDVVRCIALPRETLEVDGVDDGLSMTSVGASLPIFDQVYYSLGGISRSVAAGENTASSGYATRALFAWARPRGQGFSVTSAWADVFEEGPCVQPHHRFRAETLRKVLCSCVGKVDTSGDTLEVRLTTTSGDTLTLSETSTTSGSWVTASALDVYAEDLSTNDGRRSDTDEIVRVEARCTGAGPKTGRLEGLSMIDSVAP